MAACLPARPLARSLHGERRGLWAVVEPRGAARVLPSIGACASHGGFVLCAWFGWREGRAGWLPRRSLSAALGSGGVRRWDAALPAACPGAKPLAPTGAPSLVTTAASVQSRLPREETSFSVWGSRDAWCITLGLGRGRRCVLGEKLCCQAKLLQERVSKPCSVRDVKKSLVGSSQRPFREGSLDPSVCTEGGAVGDQGLVWGK